MPQIVAACAFRDYVLIFFDSGAIYQLYDNGVQIEFRFIKRLDDRS